MDALNAAAALISLAALFSWLNHRYIRQPASIALLLFSLALSLALVALGKLHIGAERYVQQAIAGVQLDRALLDSMLSFLLFAGALQVDLRELARRKWAIGFLASLGVLVSALLAGGALWAIFRALGHPLPFAWCLLFGALISPTDPIAVLGILKTAGAERALAGKMAGEALLNDGFGVVLFVLFLGVAAGGERADAASAATLFAREVVGGALFGLVLGLGANRMLAAIDSYKVEILLTLAVVMGGYALALALHVSGPIAIVVAGMLIGTLGRRHAMSAHSRERLDDFWELLDEIMNAVLFVMVGLELLRLEFDRTFAWAAALAVPAVLAARFVSVGIGALLPGLRAEFPPRVVALLTWGGLRGGISVALALALPASPHRDAIITVTYVVVLFSILVQGLTLSRALRFLMPRAR
ncbi:MAG: sodium:proton antiporter [Betaproteobacteria bacterium]|nr:MAG: sodium:proton antiporter [Betaproteobacteria bacterium]